MKLPKSQKLTKDYTLAAHKELESPPVFKLRGLSDAKFNQVSDLLTSDKKATGLWLAAEFGVIGWEGFDEEFTPEALKELDKTVKYELGGEVFELSQLTEQEKN